MNTIKDLIKAFQKTPRAGGEKDDPEGSRYILVSETMVNVIIKILEDSIKPKGAI